MTLQQIIDLVDASHDLPSVELRKIAWSLPIYDCSMYVVHMKKRHNIDVYV